MNLKDVHDCSVLVISGKQKQPLAAASSCVLLGPSSASQQPLQPQVPSGWHCDTEDPSRPCLVGTAARGLGWSAEAGVARGSPSTPRTSDEEFCKRSPSPRRVGVAGTKLYSNVRLRPWQEDQHVVPT